MYMYSFQRDAKQTQNKVNVTLQANGQQQIYFNHETYAWVR